MPKQAQNGYKFINFAEIPEGTYVSSSFFSPSDMIDKQALKQFVEQSLEGSDCYLVDLTIGSDNNIVVEIDSDTSVDIDRCVELTRKIEAEFNRDDEDYELEVGSAGLTSPLRVERQYRKNLGNKLEVLTSDGRKLRGVLREVTPEGITLEVEEKVRREGSKRPELVKSPLVLPYTQIKRAEYMLEF